MKILHICVTGPYTDGFNYQENLLTKYQVKEGHDVYVIASKWYWGDQGAIQKWEGPLEYVNEVGVKIKRLPIKGDKNIFYRYKRFEHFYNSIEKICPETIFVHNLQFLDVMEIVKYAKGNKVRIYADNHADFSNSARSKLAVLFYKLVWRYMAQSLEPYTEKFYGVLPARVKFLREIYSLPEKKCALLVMGADDEEVLRSASLKNKERIRKKFGFSVNDFIIVTGGKIDVWKKQTLLLMQAVRKLQSSNVKLLIFGPISNDMKAAFDSLFDGTKMRYVKWANSSESYDYFSVADLVVFPGRHSVYWEQVAGQGKPMMCKYWEGTTHIDQGGNVHFLYHDDAEEILEGLNSVLNQPEKYGEMKKIAQDTASIFSYQNIAKQSISQ